MVKRDLKTEDFKDRYLGQRAFIIGNGPSLTPEILNRLALTDWATFGMNRIGQIFYKTHWRPKFYVGTTTAIKDKRHRTDNLVGIQSAEVAFCWDEYKGCLDSIDDNVIYVHCSQTGPIKHQDASNDFWSDDIANRLSKFAVTAFPAMQVAAFMGFNPIYLIACDGNYKPPRGGKDYSHFDTAYRPWIAYGSYDDFNMCLQRAHEIAQVAANRLGIEIINISPISKITAHKFGSLDEALAYD